MTLTSAGPAGTDADPFAGTPPADAADGLPVDRYVSLGATDDDVEALRRAFADIPPQARAFVAADLAQADDDRLREHLDAFRQSIVLSAAWEALTESEREVLFQIPEEDRTALLLLDDDERAALAEYAEATEQPEPEPVEQPAAEPTPTETDDGTGGAETSTEQQPAETETFEATDVVGRTIPRVLDAVGDDPTRAQAVLDLETARGDDARTTLVDALRRIASP